MKLPAIIQIHNASPVLPNKAMRPLLGRPVIDYLLTRIRAMPSIDQLVVATTRETIDDSIVQYCRNHHLSCFRGPADNVLELILRCAQEHKMDYFVKFWGDSPIIDVQLCEDIIQQLLTRYPHVDYLSNNHPRTHPKGMQVEIIRTGALRLASTAPDLTQVDQRKVTSYLWLHPEQFKIANIEGKQDLHNLYRLVLEYPEDWQQMEEIIQALTPQGSLFTLEQVIQFLDEHPLIWTINANRYENPPLNKKQVSGK